MRQNIHPEDLKMMVRKRFGTMASLARKYGTSKALLSMALRQPKPSGNKIIADEMGIKINELWPEWFDVTGHRLSSNKQVHKQRQKNESNSGRRNG